MGHPGGSVIPMATNKSSIVDTRKFNETYAGKIVSDKGATSGVEEPV
jgi:hypothetical protein